MKKIVPITLWCLLAALASALASCIGPPPPPRPRLPPPPPGLPRPPLPF